MSGAGPTEVVLAAPPRLAPLYARALAAPRPRRDRGRPATGLPDRVVLVRAAPVDGGQLARYARVCGFALTDAAPVTYPHLLAFGAQVHLMAARGFPVPLLGLVHLRQVVTQHRALVVGERPSVRVWAERFTAHPRGATVDLRAALAVDGEVVWQGLSTYLSRGAQAPPAEAADAPGTGPEPVVGARTEPLTGPATAMWPVAADTGRRYAAVSGDVNPIHLSALTARALGFPRAIAHGMWTTARTVAALGPRLPAAATVDVAFARPLLLPSTAALLVRPDGSSGSTVAVRSGSLRDLHLSGTAVPGGRAL